MGQKALVEDGSGGVGAVEEEEEEEEEDLRETGVGSCDRDFSSSVATFSFKLSVKNMIDVFNCINLI